MRYGGIKLAKPANYSAIPLQLATGNGASEGLATTGESESQRCDTGLGNLYIFYRLDTGNTHCANAYAAHQNRHTTFQHTFQRRRSHEREAAAIDEIFIYLGLTASQRRGSGLGRRNMRRNRRGTIQTLQPQKMTT